MIAIKNKQKTLKQKFLSSWEYSQVKNLKNFNAENYTWDSSTQLYKKTLKAK